jgi:hypothetical protein
VERASSTSTTTSFDIDDDLYFFDDDARSTDRRDFPRLPRLRRPTRPRGRFRSTRTHSRPDARLEDGACTF